MGDVPRDAVVPGAGRPADVHGRQRLLLGDAGRPDRDVHRGAAARRHRALAGGAGREPPQPDRRTGRAVALPRPGPAVAGGRGVHRAGVRPELPLPADARQLRPAGHVHLRGHRRQRADRQPPVAGARLRSGGVGARPRGPRPGVAAPHPGAGAVVRALRRLPARDRGGEHQQLRAGGHRQPAGLRGHGVRGVPQRGRGVLDELHRVERQPVVQRLRQQRLAADGERAAAVRVGRAAAGAGPRHPRRAERGGGR